MRCPACGARNSEAAAWCTQCYAVLGGPPSTTAPRPDHLPAEPAEPALPASATGAPSDGAARDVRTVGGQVQWRCATCGGWSPLDDARCATCAAPRLGFGEAPPPPRLDPSARGRLVGASVLFPGLGHLLARRTGTGLARLLLAVSWVVGAVVILAGGGGGLASLPAVPLLLGAGLLWGGSVRDTVALVDGRPELLRPRVLSWLTGGVLVALVLLTLVAGGRAGAAG